MAARQQRPRHGEVDRVLRDARRSANRSVQRSGSSAKRGMPWWGWLIAGFLALKALQVFAPDHSAPAPQPTETTVTAQQEGQ